MAIIQTAYFLNEMSPGVSDSVDSKAAMPRYGVLEVRNGERVLIQRRFLPKLPSVWEAWLDARWRRLPDNCLRLYYNAPYRCPGFLVLAYARAGQRTSIASLRKGLLALDEIAKAQGMQAIVCEARNPKLTARVMAYFGYVRHASHLKGHHYIKRFTTRRD